VVLHTEGKISRMKGGAYSE